MSLLENNPVRRINGSGGFFGYDPISLDMENSMKILRTLRPGTMKLGLFKDYFFHNETSNWLGLSSRQILCDAAKTSECALIAHEFDERTHFLKMQIFCNIQCWNEGIDLFIVLSMVHQCPWKPGARPEADSKRLVLFSLQGTIIHLHIPFKNKGRSIDPRFPSYIKPIIFDGRNRETPVRSPSPIPKRLCRNAFLGPR